VQPLALCPDLGSIKGRCRAAVEAFLNLAAQSGLIFY
jgi:hypothetical protein